MVFFDSMLRAFIVAVQVAVYLWPTRLQPSSG